MIKEMVMANRSNAEEVLTLQLASYKVEAEIIGSYEIPPLKDTVSTLQYCGETFFGYYEADKLCGAISFKLDNGEMDIHRLIVHPSHFRRGIAQVLFTFIENAFEVETIKVATGSKNTPAIQFYKKNGFQFMNEITVNELLSLSFFQKKA
ncbi:GNAT family N-acetyltransferase [Ornithinibacillus sp. BX22]|uniref:GNAT family N-acetyltransferase n=2 Tax=Ornithinibacillus TaxID=484508 RepID=A0A923RI32_9BACI|nr:MULTISPECIES: GNAT family N-acetyltransferase [Ornithinibacillus]MBC5635467.1 GNAT family N-acetyltransferase [Ornithinibacillus hominis]MBS3679077.1 GNAT family N-acetyltransferase [Ornithinibacillus massiliensis]